MHEFAAAMTERLTNRLLDELAGLEVPEPIFELVYGMSFFANYQPDLDPDFPAVLKSSIKALIDTGGL